MGYHLCTTVPVALQSVIQLCRTIMSLTKKKVLRDIPTHIFYHLLYKEFLRAMVGGGLACTTLGLMPRMMWDTQLRLIPTLFVLFGYSLSNAIYSISCFIAVRIMLDTNGGVSVPMLIKTGLKEKVVLSGGDSDDDRNRSSSIGAMGRLRSESSFTDYDESESERGEKKIDSPEKVFTKRKVVTKTAAVVVTEGTPSGRATRSSLRSAKKGN